MKPRSTCARIESDLIAYVMGDLPEDRAAALRAHLAECGSCRASAQELANTLDLLRDALAASNAVPDRLTPERRAAVMSARPSPSVVWLDDWLVPLTRAAVFLLIPAAILVAVITPLLRRESSRSSRLALKTAGSAEEKVAAELADEGRYAGRSASPAMPPRASAAAPATRVLRETLAETADDRDADRQIPVLSSREPAPVGAGRAGAMNGAVAASAARKDVSRLAEQALREPAAAPEPAAEFLDSMAIAHARATGVMPPVASAPSQPTLPIAIDKLAVRRRSESTRGTVLDAPIAAGDGAVLSERDALASRLAHETEADMAARTGDAYGFVAGAKADAPALYANRQTDSRQALKGRISTQSANLAAVEKAEERSIDEKSVAQAATDTVMQRAASARPSEPATAPPAKPTPASVALPESTRAKSNAPQYRRDEKPSPRSEASQEAEPDSARVIRREPAAFHPIVETAENAFSTFAIDVDTASYTMARRAILEGRRPEPESVRTEEFVNAFDYDYAPPLTGAFAIHVDGAPSPFRKSMDLLRIGVKARRIGRDQHTPANLTLVIDTSGSMQTDDRIGLVRRALRMLVERLDPDDRVAVVQFGSQASLRLEPTPAKQKEAILAVIDSLAPGGSTQLEGGLKLGYEVAARAFRSGASNRVILLSDGVANLGATEANDILATVEAFRRQGVRLTVLGFGTGAYNDAMLETLADRGDGAYAFIDSEEEAQRVLVDELAATLHVVAADAKIQVEFNRRRVARWRQLGYENRALAREQFRDDAVDAGEVGSGQSVTALYDVQLIGDAAEWIGVVRIRYRDVETGRVEEVERRITARDFSRDVAAASPRFRLAAAVAEFAELLRLSPYTFSQGRDFSEVRAVVRTVAMELSLDARVQELAELVRMAASLPL